MNSEEFYDAMEATRKAISPFVFSAIHDINAFFDFKRAIDSVFDIDADSQHDRVVFTGAGLGLRIECELEERLNLDE